VRVISGRPGHRRTPTGICFGFIARAWSDRASISFLDASTDLDSSVIAHRVYVPRADRDPSLIAPNPVKIHTLAFTAVRSVEKRAPLLVLSGDVGTGKTELAETVGDPTARHLNMENQVLGGYGYIKDFPVTLYPLSLRAWKGPCRRDDFSPNSGIRSRAFGRSRFTRWEGSVSSCSDSVN
jgi:hypothetical protein